MNPRNTSARIASLFAAAVTTALIAGSQLGIASGYIARADALFAGRHGAPVAKNTGAAASQAPRI